MYFKRSKKRVIALNPEAMHRFDTYLLMGMV